MREEVSRTTKLCGFMERAIKGWTDKKIYGGGNNKVRSKVENKGLYNDRVRQPTDLLKAFSLSGRVVETPSRGVQVRSPGDELIFCCHLSIMRGRREPSLLRSAEGRPP
ncbi:hypothetical protein J6590_012474 [Homalodisca vitripennis]|nr:hypothetical protein J6590_012474 [Homalodisca vitripennis]